MPKATKKVIIRKVQFMGTASVRCRIKSPTQLVRGPGRTGKKLPMIPRIIKKRPKKRRKISIMVGCMYETKKRGVCYKVLKSTKKLV